MEKYYAAEIHSPLIKQLPVVPVDDDASVCSDHCEGSVTDVIRYMNRCAVSSRQSKVSLIFFLVICTARKTGLGRVKCNREL